MKPSLLFNVYRRTALLALAAVVVWWSVGGAYAGPSGDTDQAIRPGSRPGGPGTHHSAERAGELVSAQPLSLSSYPRTRVWRIRYRSTTSTGAPDIVSGAVIVPLNANATTPIVGYAPGTLGLGDRCAQSRNLDASLFDPTASTERELIQKYTSTGYGGLGFAVAITDYQGLGTPGGYPYTAGRSEGHATLDALRAAQQLPGGNLSPTAPVAVTGYSQGGLAAGWAAQLAPSYAPELKLVGGSVGAPPADANANVRFLDGKPNFGLVLAAVYGMNVAYPELHLDRYLNAKGRAAIAEVADDCVADLGEKSKWANHRLSEYTTQDFLARPDWRAKLARESLGGSTPQVPVLLYASPDDDIVPYASVARLRHTWRKHGADVTFYAPDTGNHGLTGLSMSPVATGWVAARLIGLPLEQTR